jgi:hypothetical protein
MNEQNVKAIWQSLPTELANISEPQLQQHVAGFRRLISRRNLQEGFCALMVSIIFGYYAWTLPEYFMRIGSAFIVVGSLVILYQLRFRAGLQKPSPEQLGLPSAMYVRQELVRQRDLLRGIWLSQFVPLLPGFGLFFWGMAQPNPADFPWQITAVIIIPFVVVFVMNVRTAQKLQIEIDKLDQQIAE